MQASMEFRKCDSAPEASYGKIYIMIVGTRENIQKRDRPWHKTSAFTTTSPILRKIPILRRCSLPWNQQIIRCHMDVSENAKSELHNAHQQTRKRMELCTSKKLRKPHPPVQFEKIQSDKHYLNRRHSNSIPSYFCLRINACKSATY